MNQLKQYQARIKFIKYSFLGLGICLILATLITIIYSLNPHEGKKSIDLSVNEKKPKLSKDCSLTVQNPIFSGVTNNSLPYTILADRMTKDKTNHYILESVAGECLTKNGNITIKAMGGKIDEMEKNIKLKEDILIIYNGASLKASQINLNLHQQDINSDEPVLIEFSNSYIKADRLESEDYSEIIRLKGNVESVIEVDNF